MKIHKDVLAQAKKDAPKKLTVKELVAKEGGLSNKRMLDLLTEKGQREDRIEFIHDTVIPRHKEAIVEAENETEEQKKEVQILEKAIKELPPHNPERMLKKILANPLVYACDFTEWGGRNALLVTTQPLFTDIRIKEGSAKKKRTMLGVFSIIMQSDGTVRIKNYTFTGRNHWAVRNETGYNAVCTGDWTSIIKAYMASGEFHLAIQTVLALLTSADTDGSAYIRSHVWRKHRGYNGHIDDEGLVTDGYHNLPWNYGDIAGLKCGSIVYSKVDWHYGFAILYDTDNDRVIYFNEHGGNGAYPGIHIPGWETMDVPRGYQFNITGGDYGCIAPVPEDLQKQLVGVIYPGNKESEKKAKKIIDAYYKIKGKKDSKVFPWLDSLTQEQAQSIFTSLIGNE